MNPTTQFSSSSYEDDSSYEDEDDKQEEKSNIENNKEKEEEEDSAEDDSFYEDEDDDDKQEEKPNTEKNKEKGEEEGAAEDDDYEIKNKKKASSSSVDLSKRSIKKRKRNEEDVVDVDLSKPKPKITTTTASGASGSKLSFFEKIWSNESELIVLQGLIDYKKKYKEMVVSSTDYKIVLESIKDLLPKSYTIIQLRSKVRKFRDKYDKLISGVKNPNENDPHQEKLFELSKNYWGDTIKPKVLKEMHEVPYYYLDQFCRVNNASLTLPPSLLAITAKKGWEESIGKANAVYLNKKAKDLMIAEGEVFVQRCQVILDQTKLMLDVLKQ